MIEHSAQHAAVRVTPLNQSYSFGYFEKTPWDATGRYLLAMRTDTPDGQVLRGDEWAELGMIDLHRNNHFRVLDRTRAWSRQQGSMLQWTVGDPDRLVIYNQADGQRLFSAIRDVHSGDFRELDRPIYALSPDGRHATSVNFARLGAVHPGYGYPVVADPWQGVDCPADDGLFITDLHTGRSRLLISCEEVARRFPDRRPAAGAHWIHVAQYNTDGSRISFLHRWLLPGDGNWLQRVVTRFFTINSDGTNLRLLFDEEMISHYDWRDPDTILAFAKPYQDIHNYYLFEVCTGTLQPEGDGVLRRDGHPTYSPDRRWILTDTYPLKKDPHRELYLYETMTGRRVDVGKFYSPPDLDGESRCDLHPRWNRDGTQVCIDSVHEGRRSMYVIDVSSITRALEAQL